MKKFSLALAAALSICALPACTDKSDQSNTVVESKDMQTIDMVATHAIDTEVSVAQLTFVPNSVAPWLGRVILLDDAGHLYSTDIEGRAPKPVGSGTYIDIFGLAREKAAGVFLAITADNKIEAFIESDDDGNFSPMIYSGDSIDAKGFCWAMAPAASSARVLSKRNEADKIALTIYDNRVEVIITGSEQLPKNASDCSYNILDYNVRIVQSNFTGNSHEPKTGNGFTGKLGENHSILIPGEPSGLVAINTGGEVDGFQINIKNGLSVGGVEHVKYITSTKSNYGAGGYNTGVLALVDADANRIVFISLSYAERQLMKALNPPTDVQ